MVIPAANNLRQTVSVSATKSSQEQLSHGTLTVTSGIFDDFDHSLTLIPVYACCPRISSSLLSLSSSILKCASKYNPSVGTSMAFNDSGFPQHTSSLSRRTLNPASLMS